MGRLLFDTTRLQSSGLHTGIQRVVRCLMAALKEPGVAAGHQVLPVIFDEDQWFSSGELAPHPLQGVAGKAQPAATAIVPGYGDALLLFDASWYARPWPAVDKALAAGARLYGMVHDLLPIERPEWFRPDLSRPFEQHLHAMADRAECLFVPSRVVAERLDNYLKVCGLAARIEILPHGGNFHPCHGEQVSPPLEVLPLLDNAAGPAAETYLVLGTLEPRKNQALLLDAFDTLWAAGSSARLVVVGREGWQVDGLMDRLQRHPQRNRRLFHCSGLNDLSLLYLLRHASAMIYFSSDEGFGLPVLEAAMQGCPVIASDIPVLREVGRNWAYYVSIDDPQALLHALEQRLYVRQIACAPRRSWVDVAQQLLSILRGAPADNIAVDRSS